jgi:hypothetical protein
LASKRGTWGEGPQASSFLQTAARSMRLSYVLIVTRESSYVSVSHLFLVFHRDNFQITPDRRRDEKPHTGNNRAKTEKGKGEWTTGGGECNLGFVVFVGAVSGKTPTLSPSQLVCVSPSSKKNGDTMKVRDISIVSVIVFFWCFLVTFAH